MVVSSFSELEQGKLVTLGRFESEVVSAGCKIVSINYFQLSIVPHLLDPPRT